mgnify:CR=1 FL=1
MDKVDSYILKTLQDNARTPNSDIAKALKMAPSAILERIRRLESKGIIKGYKAIINPKAIQLDLLAYITISLNVANWSEKYNKAILAIPNVEEAHEILGADSYFVKLRVKDMDELSDLLTNEIGSLPSVASTNTVMVIKSLRDNGNYPIKVPKK